MAPKKGSGSGSARRRVHGLKYQSSNSSLYYYQAGLPGTDSLIFFFPARSKWWQSKYLWLLRPKNRPINHITSNQINNTYKFSIRVHLSTPMKTNPFLIIGIDTFLISWKLPNAFDFHLQAISKSFTFSLNILLLLLNLYLRVKQQMGF